MKVKKSEIKLMVERMLDEMALTEAISWGSEDYDDPDKDQFHSRFGQQVPDEFMEDDRVEEFFRAVNRALKFLKNWRNLGRLQEFDEDDLNEVVFFIKQFEKRRKFHEKELGRAMRPFLRAVNEFEEAREESVALLTNNIKKAIFDVYMAVDDLLDFISIDSAGLAKITKAFFVDKKNFHNHQELLRQEIIDWVESLRDVRNAVQKAFRKFSKFTSDTVMAGE